MRMSLLLVSFFFFFNTAFDPTKMSAWQSVIFLDCCCWKISMIMCSCWTVTVAKVHQAPQRLRWRRNKNYQIFTMNLSELWLASSILAAPNPSNRRKKNLSEKKRLQENITSQFFFVSFTTDKEYSRKKSTTTKVKEALTETRREKNAVYSKRQQQNK